MKAQKKLSATKAVRINVYLPPSIAALLDSPKLRVVNGTIISKSELIYRAIERCYGKTRDAL